MQYRESFMRRTHEDGNAHRPSQVGYREQSLHPRDIADSNAQTAVLFIDLRHSISLYGLLDSDPHTMLVYIEEKQLFKCSALLYRQFRRNAD